MPCGLLSGTPPPGDRALPSSLCTGLLDPLGIHALLCLKGGCVVRRHNALRDILALLIKASDVYSDVTLEQIIPQASSKLDAPRLDIVAYGGPNGTTRLDVTVGVPSSPAGLRAGAATQTGAAARVLESAKRRKYPGTHVSPFALEAYGHLGETALSFLRTLARHLPFAERGPYLAKAHQAISATLQRENAKSMILAMRNSS